MDKKIIVLYHGDCMDGFAGAYSAWRKFGDSAEYTPLYDREVPPNSLLGKEVYIIDFSFPKEVLIELEKKVEKLVVLDHHIGVKDSVESIKGGIFNNENSGAVMAWKYFFNDKKVPNILSYIEDADIWKYSLSDTKFVRAYIAHFELDNTFEKFDKLVEDLEDDNKLKKIIEKGASYREEYLHNSNDIVRYSALVDFDGYKILAVNCSRNFRSEVGNILATKNPPFGIVWYFNKGKWRFSLRGDGSIDLTKIVEKYGGSGHKNAAGFDLPFGTELPFKFIK